MTYREILVDAGPRKDVRQTLECAQQMAADFSAKLTAASFAWPRTSIPQILAGNPLSVQQQYREAEQAMGSVRRAFDNLFGDDTAEHDWCSDVTEPTTGLCAHSFTADLLITSAVEDPKYASPDVPGLALRSGVPILRLGEAAATGRFPRAVVAWKDCAQARRAMHDALPILQRTDSVKVVGVGDEVASDRLEAVADHLRRHEVTAEYLHVQRTHRDIGEDLLAAAQSMDANLIVAGVYSRGSFSERILGGVTKDLLEKTGTSWFMAH